MNTIERLLTLESAVHQQILSSKPPYSLSKVVHECISEPLLIKFSLMAPQYFSLLFPEPIGDCWNVRSMVFETAIARHVPKILIVGQIINVLSRDGQQYIS